MSALRTANYSKKIAYNNYFITCARTTEVDSNISTALGKSNMSRGLPGTLQDLSSTLSKGISAQNS